MAKRKEAAARTPENVAAIRAEIRRFFDQTNAAGRKIGNSNCGVYLFYDFDQEPIYVGQTVEKLRGRVSRHLTNRRTDAVAMNVLDPVEVAEIEIWPLDELVEGMEKKERQRLVNRAEATVFHQALAASRFHAVLNEKEIPAIESMQLPKSFRGRIIPDALLPALQHPDVRLARRAATIAALARVISERDVSDGLRRTLLTQAQRLEFLSRQRIDELGIKAPNRQSPQS